VNNLSYLEEIMEWCTYDGESVHFISSG
jgi:hypothetical protein